MAENMEAARDAADGAAERLHAVARVADAFDALPGNQRVLMAVLQACKEPCTAQDLDALMEPIMASNRSVHTAVELRRALEDHGAIRYVQSDEEQLAEAQAQDAADNGEAEVPEIDEEGYYVVSTPAPGTWQLTEAGREYLEGDPLGAYARDLLEGREPQYAPVYRELLELLAEGPATKPEVDKVAESNPLTQEPRMYGGHFVGELEKAGLAAWDGAWVITQLGRETLAGLQAGMSSERE